MSGPGRNPGGTIYILGADMPTSTPSLLLLALVSGCLAPKPIDSTATDDTGSDGGGGATVYDVNDGTVPQEEVVTLEDVVVTSPFNRDADGFFVADPKGGAGSGLFVWRQMGMDGVVVSEGDELRITGTPSDFYGWMEFVIDSTDDIEVTGEAVEPAPVDLGDGSGVDWEDYESVAVTLDDQSVTAIDEYNTGTLSGGILLDDGFEFLDYDCGGAWSSVTGIVFFQYDAHSLNPRTDADFGTYTTPEATVATVADIQAGNTCGPVILENVVATTPNSDDDTTSIFFVQDAGGGDGSGVAVFSPNGNLTVSTGDIVTVTGSSGEFYGFTEVSVADPADVSVDSSGGTPVAETVTEDPADGDWEPYEGMLITLADVTATSASSYGEVDTNHGIKLDTLYYEHDADNGDTFSSVTGVVYYDYEEWKLEPRSAADLVP
jgi:predicted extracellular nuclease